jgi:transcriptional regulator with XRE-family HTH domain
VIAKRGVRSAPKLSNPARQALKQLGKHLQQARLRRRIPAALLAERASISRSTLQKIEHGEAGVAIGNYATVPSSLGLIDALAQVRYAAAYSLNNDRRRRRNLFHRFIAQRC